MIMAKRQQRHSAAPEPQSDTMQGADTVSPSDPIEEATWALFVAIYEYNAAVDTVNKVIADSGVTIAKLINKVKDLGATVEWGDASPPTFGPKSQADYPTVSRRILYGRKP